MCCCLLSMSICFSNNSSKAFAQRKEEREEEEGKEEEERVIPWTSSFLVLIGSKKPPSLTTQDRQLHPRNLRLEVLLMDLTCSHCLCACLLIHTIVRIHPGSSSIDGVPDCDFRNSGNVSCLAKILFHRPAKAWPSGLTP